LKKSGSIEAGHAPRLRVWRFFWAFSALKKSGSIEVKKPLEPQEKGLSKM